MLQQAFIVRFLLTGSSINHILTTHKRQHKQFHKTVKLSTKYTKNVNTCVIYTADINRDIRDVAGRLVYGKMSPNKNTEYFTYRAIFNPINL